MAEIFHPAAVRGDTGVIPAEKEILPRLPVPPEQPCRPPPRGMFPKHEQESGQQPFACRELVDRPFPSRGTFPVAARGVPVSPAAEHGVAQAPVKRGGVTAHTFFYT